MSSVPPAREMVPVLMGKAPVMRSLVAVEAVKRPGLVRDPASVRVPERGSMVPLLVMLLLILPKPSMVAALEMASAARRAVVPASSMTPVLVKAGPEVRPLGTASVPALAKVEGPEIIPGPVKRPEGELLIGAKRRMAAPLRLKKPELVRPVPSNSAVDPGARVAEPELVIPP